MDVTKKILGKTYGYFTQDSLYRNSTFLIANSAASAFFGFIFWVIAARNYTTSEVGLAASVLAAIGIISSISFFGFDYSLIKFLPTMKSKAKLIHTALNISAILSILISFFYLFIVPHITPKLYFLTASVGWVLIFLLINLFTSWNSLTNTVFIAYRSAQYALFSSLVFGVLRLPLLFFDKHSGKSQILISQLVGLTIGGIILSFIFLWKIDKYKYRPKIYYKIFKKKSRYTTATYAADITANLPTLILPLIVLDLLGAKYAAFYYIAVLIAGLLMVIPQSTSQSLIAEGSNDYKNIKKYLIRALKFIYPIFFIGLLLLISLGWFLLSLFGKEYARGGYVLFAILCISATPKIISYLLSAVIRVRGDVSKILIISIIGAVAEIIGSIVGIKVYHSLSSVGLATLGSELLMSVCYVYIFVRNGQFKNL